MDRAQPRTQSQRASYPKIPTKSDANLQTRYPTQTRPPSHTSHTNSSTSSNLTPPPTSTRSRVNNPPQISLPYRKHVAIGPNKACFTPRQPTRRCPKTRARIYMSLPYWDKACFVRCPKRAGHDRQVRRRGLSNSTCWRWVGDVGFAVLTLR